MLLRCLRGSHIIFRAGVCHCSTILPSNGQGGRCVAVETPEKVEMEEGFSINLNPERVAEYFGCTVEYDADEKARLVAPRALFAAVSDQRALEANPETYRVHMAAVKYVQDHADTRRLKWWVLLIHTASPPDSVHVGGIHSGMFIPNPMGHPSLSKPCVQASMYFPNADPNQCIGQTTSLVQTPLNKADLFAL